MALIKTGPLVETVSGNVGGVCFSKFRGRPYVRAAQRHIKKTTQAAYAARASFKRVCLAWDELSDDKHAQWHTTARTFSMSNRFGTKYWASPRQLFMAVNMIFEHYAGDTATLAPFLGRTATPPVTTLQFFEDGPYNLKFTPAPPLPSTWVAVHFSFTRKPAYNRPDRFHFITAYQWFVGVNKNLFPLWPATLRHPVDDEKFVLRLLFFTAITAGGWSGIPTAPFEYLSTCLP